MDFWALLRLCRKYPLFMYILGVLNITPAWVQVGRVVILNAYIKTSFATNFGRDVTDRTEGWNIGIYGQTDCSEDLLCYIYR